MEERRIFCSKCGAPCKETDIFCNSCSTLLNKNNVSSDDQCLSINGIPVTELHSMIQKNCARYLAVFRENEEKSFFISWNWGAALANIYWFFYRGMFLMGILALLFINVLGCVGGVVAAGLQRNRIETYQPQLEAFVAEYGDPGAIRAMYDEQHASELLGEYYELEEKSALNSGEIYLGMIVVSLVSNAVVGMLANWLYRRHLLKRTRNYGTSFPRLIGAAVFMYLFGNVTKEIIAMIVLAFTAALL